MIPSLVFLHCNHTPHCTATVDKHFDYTTLQLKTAGSVELFYDDERHFLEGPCLWPAMPGPHIRFHRAPGCPEWDHRYVAFSGNGVRELVDPSGLLARPLALPTDRVQSITRIMDDLIDSATDPDELRRMKATTILQRLLLEAAELRTATGSGPGTEPWLAIVMRRLETSGPRPDYEAIAREAGMSVPTLRRRFRAASGVAIHEHHLRSRLAEARRLLAESQIAIKEIAARLEYSDVFYFTRQFSAKVGVSPGVYRASVQTTSSRRQR